ncbi:hypothetical protein CPter91_4280 [Collimonas pratensis]|uniref:Uncharacterized protein n=1 Tax=Collimonas pratensis TaxID=279113 RepID=A0A127Q975_9BURK|nr:hypothetical protein CPter91_4280 [Collimonas pratensis]
MAAAFAQAAQQTLAGRLPPALNIAPPSSSTKLPATAVRQW